MPARNLFYNLLIVRGKKSSKARKMPPKKKGAGEEKTPLLGRFGTSLKIGIVGIPNVG